MCMEVKTNEKDDTETFNKTKVTKTKTKET